MSDELKIAIEAANKATEILLNYYNKGDAGKVEKKDLVDKVSDADINSEKIIRKILEDSFPDYNIAGEELGESARHSDYTWYIDPICGSNDFIRGFPEFGLSIALVFKGEVVLGVCGLPAFKELYWAEKGQGAFMNGVKISVSGIQDINDIIITSHISAKTKNIENIKSSADLVAKIARFYLKIPGPFPYSACNLARGRSDAHVELNVTAIHRLGGTIIVLEAGGKLTKPDGKEAGIFDDDIILSNGLIHDELIKVLNS